VASSNTYNQCFYTFNQDYYTFNWGYYTLNQLLCPYIFKGRGREKGYKMPKSSGDSKTQHVKDKILSCNSSSALMFLREEAGRRVRKIPDKVITIYIRIL
jgi:hypothetical protein